MWCVFNCDFSHFTFFLIFTNVDYFFLIFFKYYN